MSRNFGGGSVMVWGAFGYKKKSEIVFLNGCQNAAMYQDVLSNHLWKMGRGMAGNKWIFQQDNASIHNARTTFEWFNKKNHGIGLACTVPRLESYREPQLVRLVYGGDKQYQTIVELKQAIQSQWDLMNQDGCKKLIDSMHKRCFDVIKIGGKSIKY
uniref:Tc1-like transposase DDE domain-containing protein n=1 Tax=Strigamia maritima TaxID=126957 RepID=T1JA34_STRMM